MTSIALPLILAFVLCFSRGIAQTISTNYTSVNEPGFLTGPPLPLTASVAGKVVTELGTVVPSVTINLTGSSSGLAISSVTGQYYFNLTPEGTYSIKPSKNNDVLITNGITTIDLLMVRQHVLATFPLSSPYKIIAADVDGSGAVGTLDFLLIRTVVLQINSTFPSGRLWTFVKSDFVFANPRVPFPYESARAYPGIMQDFQNQDFIGIKLGDVNNTWDPATPKMSSVEEVELVIGEAQAAKGQEIRIPVKAKGFNNVTGYQFTVSWNADVISLINAYNKTLNGYYGLERKMEGYLTTTWYDEMVRPVSLNDDDTLFELKFIAMGENGSSSEIKIGSELTASEAYNENLDLLEIQPSNGIVKVSDDWSTSCSSSSHLNLRIFPNPFTNETAINFTLPLDGEVGISIYDAKGKKVSEMTKFYNSGEHQISWTGNSTAEYQLPDGCYYVRITTEQLSVMAKVMLMR